MRLSLGFGKLYRRLPVLLLVGGSIIFASSAFGDEPVGNTVAVVQATPPGPEKPVYSGDTIETAADDMVQIRFRDNTRIVVGPESSLVIEKYTFNPDGTLAGANLRLVRGTFRFISGDGPEKLYNITTPTGKISIKGTEVDVAASDHLGTGVLVFEGAVELCSTVLGSGSSGSCTLVQSNCGTAVASPSGQLQEAGTPETKAALIRNSFPLVERQDALSGPFRVGTSGCRLNKSQ